MPAGCGCPRKTVRAGQTLICYPVLKNIRAKKLDMLICSSIQ